MIKIPLTVNVDTITKYVEDLSPTNLVDPTDVLYRSGSSTITITDYSISVNSSSGNIGLYLIPVTLGQSYKLSFVGISKMRVYEYDTKPTDPLTVTRVVDSLGDNYVYTPQGATTWIGLGVYGTDPSYTYPEVFNDISFNEIVLTPFIPIREDYENALLRQYTVDQLPTDKRTGTRAFATDSSSPIFLENVVGGGSTLCPVFWDGNNWKVG